MHPFYYMETDEEKMRVIWDFIPYFYGPAYEDWVQYYADYKRVYTFLMEYFQDCYKRLINWSGINRKAQLILELFIKDIEQFYNHCRHIADNLDGREKVADIVQFNKIQNQLKKDLAIFHLMLDKIEWLLINREKYTKAHYGSLGKKLLYILNDKAEMIRDEIDTLLGMILEPILKKQIHELLLDFDRVALISTFNFSKGILRWIKDSYVELNYIDVKKFLGMKPIGEYKDYKIIAVRIPHKYGERDGFLIAFKNHKDLQQLVNKMTPEYKYQLINAIRYWAKQYVLFETTAKYKYHSSHNLFGRSTYIYSMNDARERIKEVKKIWPFLSEVELENYFIQRTLDKADRDFVSHIIDTAPFIELDKSLFS